VTTSMPDDLGGMLAGMARIQQELEVAQESAAAAAAVGSAGGGAVTVRVSGEFSFDSVTIEPALVGSADAALLEDLVLVAIRSAVDQLLERRKSAMGGLISGAFGSLLAGGTDDPTTESD
jgi:DNA-binding YbaB/EbfC family protein